MRTRLLDKIKCYLKGPARILRDHLSPMAYSAIRNSCIYITSAQCRVKQREFSRLRNIPRYQATQTSLLGAPIELIDAASFIYMYQEIFNQQVYRFEAESQCPYIIDCGANVGLSIMYFKQLYPMSKIVAFEPDQNIFSVLEKNIRGRGYKNVDILPCAAWIAEERLSFMSEKADGGRIVQGDDIANSTVQAVRLRNYIDRQVDLLKIDIEGAETDVLVDCKDLLNKVDKVFVEYHSFEGQPQNLHAILGILNEAGFRIHVHPPLTSPQPFFHRSVWMGMDMQLNIFAFRQ